MQISYKAEERVEVSYWILKTGRNAELVKNSNNQVNQL